MTFEFFHQIGGLRFHTTSNCRFRQLASPRYTRFSTVAANSDVRQEIIAVDPWESGSSTGQSGGLEKGFFDCTSLVVPPVVLLPPSGGSKAEHLPGLPGAPVVQSLLRSRCSESSVARVSAHALSVEVFDYSSQSATVFLHREREWILASPMIEGGLRRLFSSFLPCFSGLLLHSAAVDVGGKTVLFLGADGAGKSTAARLAGGEGVLSDDQNVVRSVLGCWQAYASPWGKVVSNAVRGPVGALFFVVKARAFCLRPVHPRDAANLIWQEHSAHWERHPASIRVASLDLVCSLVHAVPAFFMEFSADHIDCRAIRQAINSGG